MKMQAQMTAQNAVNASNMVIILVTLITGPNCTRPNTVKGFRKKPNFRSRMMISSNTVFG
jgi:hypothetical protein